MDAPQLDEHLCFSQREEDFSVQQFIAQLAVEAFAVAILPWTPRRDVNSLRTEPCQPLPELLGTLSGPLSERMCSGMPWVSVKSANTSIASLARMRRATWIAKHWRVYSSIITISLMVRPSSVRSNRKYSLKKP